MEKYLRLNLSAATRLQILRTLASARNKPSWRDARSVTFSTLEPFFSDGINDAGGVRGRVPVLVSFEHPDYYGWRMTFADEVEHSAVDHTGWFTDEDCTRTLRGLVIRLPRGRFLAGYYSNDNGEYVIFREVFDSIRDAAQYGDKQAERLADDERDHNRRFHEAHDMQSRLDDIRERLAELQVLIESGRFEDDRYEREAARLTDEAANITDKLNDEYSDVL